MVALLWQRELGVRRPGADAPARGEHQRRRDRGVRAPHLRASRAGRRFRDPAPLTRRRLCAMSDPAERAASLLAELNAFLAAADRRQTEIPIEVGEDRRWSADDTERLFRRIGRQVPVAPPEQRLSDVLAEVVRLRNALQVWL